MKSMRGWGLLLAGLSLVGMLGGLTGCGVVRGASGKDWVNKTTESFVAVATRGKMNLDTETGNVDFWDSSQKKAVRVLKKVPDGFPREFPIYPGAEVLNGLLEDDKATMVVSFEVKDTLARVKDFYDRKLSLNDWEWESLQDNKGENSIFVYRKPFSGTVWLKKVGNKVRVDVNLES